MHLPIRLLKILLHLLPRCRNLLLLLVSIIHQVHVPLLFSMTSCVFCGFLSSLTLSFVIWGDFNILVDTDCIDQQKFLNLLDSANFLQSVNKPTHLHGHILDLILSPSDSNFIGDVTVGDLILDHALVKCHLDFACPLLPEVSGISYRRYHKIDMQKFCDDLVTISFVLSPASTAAAIYNQYVHDLGCLIDMHHWFMVKLRKHQLAGCQIHIAGPNQVGISLSICGKKTGLSWVEPDWADRLPGETQLSTETKLNTTALSSMTTAVIQRSYGRHYDKFLIRVARWLFLLTSLTNPWLINLLLSSLKKSRESEIRSWHLPQPLHHPQIYPPTCRISVGSLRMTYRRLSKILLLNHVF